MAAARPVQLLGWRRDIHDLMECADLLVFPSHFMEALPVLILEEIGCRKPVVTTRHKGCEDAVEDGQTGFPVPGKQVGTLVDGIVELLDDGMLRVCMGQAGGRRVERDFELGNCTRTIINVLERARRGYLVYHSLGDDAEMVEGGLSWRPCYRRGSRAAYFVRDPHVE